MFSEPPGLHAQPNAYDDVRLIVEGNFSVDALGDDYDAILARLAAAPLEYLEAFRTLVKEGTDTNRLSSLFLPSFLTFLASTDPAAARDAARELLAAYEKAMVEAGGPDVPAALERTLRTAPETEDEKRLDRLRSRTAQLRGLVDQ